ncbi:hypothetical protein T484DRAFT_1859609 [Baffinella frigidus]|nr:hypothetical protein T484DRAFT_1859609 [Cryptophyta sp. CCMP2293]
MAPLRTVFETRADMISLLASFEHRKLDASLMEDPKEQLEKTLEQERKLRTSLARRLNNTGNYRGEHGNIMSSGEAKNNRKQVFHATWLSQHRAVINAKMADITNKMSGTPLRDIAIAAVVAPTAASTAPTKGASTAVTSATHAMICATIRSFEAIDMNDGDGGSLLQNLQHHLEQTRQAANRTDQAICKRKRKTAHKFDSDNTAHLSPYLKKVDAIEKTHATWFAQHILELVAAIETLRYKI